MKLSSEQLALLRETQKVLERTAESWFTAKRLFSKIEMSSEAIAAEAHFLGQASRNLKEVLDGLLLPSL